MEHLNRVELRGVVGRIKREKVGDGEVARISLGVDYSYEGAVGGKVKSRDWFNLLAWKSPKINFDIVTPGDIIRVVGSIRECRYIDSECKESSFMGIAVSELKWEGR